MEFLQDLFSLVGRVLISCMFLWAAYEKITHWNASGDYLRKKKIPHVTYVLPIAATLQVVGGLFVLLGLMPRLGAFFLLVYMIPHTYMLHDFWKMNDGEGKLIEKLFFMKDLAIIGGLLVILSVGGGSFAISH